MWGFRSDTWGRAFQVRGTDMGGERADGGGDAFESRGRDRGPHTA